MNFKKLLLGALLAVAFISCEKDDPEDIHEHELFSNVSLHLTPTDGGEEVEFHWHDDNGDLVVDADEIENASLAASTTYTAVVSFVEEEDEHDDDDDHDHDEDDDDHDDLDAEIIEEAEDHQLFFSFDGAGLTVSYTDADADGNPLGLETTIKTGDDYVGGSLTITLRHEPNKFEEGVADGDITNAGGETDVEVTFDLGLE